MWTVKRTLQPNMLKWHCDMLPLLCLLGMHESQKAINNQIQLKTIAFLAFPQVLNIDCYQQTFQLEKFSDRNSWCPTYQKACWHSPLAGWLPSGRYLQHNGNQPKQPIFITFERRCGNLYLFQPPWYHPGCLLEAGIDKRLWTRQQKALTHVLKHRFIHSVNLQSTKETVLSLVGRCK